MDVRFVLKNQVLHHLQGLCFILIGQDLALQLEQSIMQLKADPRKPVQLFQY